MILVTGGTGLLGSHLLYELVSKKGDITAIYRTERNFPEVKRIFGYYSDNPENVFAKIRWIKADILNYQDMVDVTVGVRELYHCAAIVSFDPARRTEMINSNTLGASNVVNACLENGVQKLVHVSSTAAIGRAPEGVLADESMIWAESKSNTGYSISKFRSEMEVWRGINEGLNSVIVNPSIILGPGFWEYGSSSIFSKVDEGLKFYSNGMTGYVGIWDVVKAMILLMEADISGERFLVTAENLSYKDVFDRVADALGRKRPSIEATKFLSELAWRLDWIKSKLFHIGEHTFTSERVRAARNVVKFDNSKIKKELDFEFERIDEVVSRTVGFYQIGQVR